MSLKEKILVGQVHIIHIILVVNWSFKEYLVGLQISLYYEQYLNGYRYSCNVYEQLSGHHESDYKFDEKSENKADEARTRRRW